MIEVKSADLSQEPVSLPEGYKLVSIAKYPGGVSPFTGGELGYQIAVQIASVTDLGKEPTGNIAADWNLTSRGTGNTVAEAVADAVARLTVN